MHGQGSNVHIAVEGGTEGRGRNKGGRGRMKEKKERGTGGKEGGNRARVRVEGKETSGSQ